ncbi:MAG: hypothetical protein ACTHKG_01625 [Nocardioides sp.]
MSKPTLDPTDFASDLERSFGFEPPHGSVTADLARGRRRLRRHRLVTATSALAVAAVAAATVSLIYGVLPHRVSNARYAAGAATDALVVQDCLQTNDRVSAYRDHVVSREELLQRMGDARLMSRADTGEMTLATLRAEDRSVWLECTLSRREPALKAITLLYPTDVSFPRTVVGGVPAYEPHDESDTRFSGTATPNIPTVQPGCVVEAPEETAEWGLDAAACPTYRITWNDRRPAEVGHVALTTPDGKELDADVREGYLSLAWTGPMTPEVARAFARGEAPRVQHIAFYDESGGLLVDDRRVGAVPTPDRVALENFPSLAWWTR